MQARTASHLTRRERHTDEREDEGRHRICKASLHLNLQHAYIVGTLGSLLVDEAYELINLHRRDDTLYNTQLANVDVDERIQISALLELHSTRRILPAFDISLGSPTASYGVNLDVSSL